MSAAPIARAQVSGIGNILTCSEIALKILLTTRPVCRWAPALTQQLLPSVPTPVREAVSSHGAERE